MALTVDSKVVRQLGRRFFLSAIVSQDTTTASTVTATVLDLSADLDLTPDGHTYTYVDKVERVVLIPAGSRFTAINLSGWRLHWTLAGGTSAIGCANTRNPMDYDFRTWANGGVRCLNPDYYTGSGDLLLQSLGSTAGDNCQIMIWGTLGFGIDTTGFITRSDISPLITAWTKQDGTLFQTAGRVLWPATTSDLEGHMVDWDDDITKVVAGKTYTSFKVVRACFFSPANRSLVQQVVPSFEGSTDLPIPGYQRGFAHKVDFSDWMEGGLPNRAPGRTGNLLIKRKFEAVALGNLRHEWYVEGKLVA